MHLTSALDLSYTCTERNMYVGSVKCQISQCKLNITCLLSTQILEPALNQENVLSLLKNAVNQICY